MVQIQAGQTIAEEHKQKKLESHFFSGIVYVRSTQVKLILLLQQLDTFY